MYTALLSALALAVNSAYGYENSSPLFLYSTSSLNIDSIPALASASTVEPILLNSLESCPTKNYLVVSQPGVSAEDFSTSGNTPLLRDRLSKIATGQTSIQIRDVVDRLDTSVVTQRIAQTCSRSTLHIDTTSMIIPDFQGNIQERVFYAEMPALHASLSPDERHVILLQHDTYLSSMIDTYFKNEDYTLVYATTSVHAQQHSIPPSESQEYEAELPIADMMHSGELRRSLAKRKEGLTSNQTVVDGPLFDKYQFLSPGIFMGLFVGFILIAILYVGISALSSLEVTYGAFNKEQGQSSGKKLG